MFLFSAVLAASVDRFVMGFLIKSKDMGVKNFVKSFVIILLCCVAATFPARLWNMVYNPAYINLPGAFLLAFLGCKALQDKEDEPAKTGIVTVSLSVAVDAAVVCMYLTLEGSNMALVCLLAAFMHSLFLLAGSRLADCIIKNKREIYTRYISRGLFFFMAGYKLYEII